MGTVITLAVGFALAAAITGIAAWNDIDGQGLRDAGRYPSTQQRRRYILNEISDSMPGFLLLSLLSLVVTAPIALLISGPLVFTCSWSDWFHPAADAWRDEAWDIIRCTPHLTYQILTKRPELIPDRLPPDWDAGWPNVWLGVSVENQRFVERAQLLARIPATVRFLSVEPMLGPLNLRRTFETARLAVFGKDDPAEYGVASQCPDTPGCSLLVDLGLKPCPACPLDLPNPINWIIVGGESGPGARPCRLEWICDIVGQCKDAEVPVFVKQMGAVLGHDLGCRDKKGGDMEAWPAVLRVREMPR